MDENNENGSKLQAFFLLLFSMSILLTVLYFVLTNKLYTQGRELQLWVKHIFGGICLLCPGAFLMLAFAFSKTGRSCLGGIMCGLIVEIIGAIILITIWQFSSKQVVMENGIIMKEKWAFTNTIYEYYEKDTWYSQLQVTP